MQFVTCGSGYYTNNIVVIVGVIAHRYNKEKKIKT